MNKLVPINSPGRMTVIAALLAAMCAPAFAADTGTKVVISQVYGAGGNNGATYQNDFIELFNRSSEDVALGGMSVQYASTKGVSWSRTNLNPVTLKPGQYYLIAQGGGASGIALPTADQSGTILMAAAAGKVALVSNTTTLTGGTPSATVVDWVGYGSGTDGFEGSGPTATISTTTSASRVGNSCTDNNDNASDFTVGAINPRNSSTIARCGGSNTPVAEPIVASCPAFTVQGGIGGFGPLSAIDKDSIVNGASITSTPVSGISLGGFTAAAADNQAATVNLNVAATVANGVYPVSVQFTNNEAQSATCTFNVTVQANASTGLTIMDIQGNGSTSPYANSSRTVEGVVTYKFPGTGTGFFIQDQNGDGNPETSDGIMIYGSTTTAAVGDIVRVTGTVFEYKPAGQPFSYTEIKDATSIVRVGTGRPIVPTNISMPMDLGRVQGMLVTLPSTIINAVNSVGNRGELTLSSVRREVPTNRYRPGTPEALALAAANAIDQIVLDDGLFTAPATIPYIGADSTVRVGDTVSGVTGVVDFGSIGNSDNGYKLQVASPADVVISRTNARGAPSFAAGNVRVASANVLNFFTTFTNGNTVDGRTGQYCFPSAPTASQPNPSASANCRGADNLNEFVRQRDKIVNELLAIDADVVGLMEIQNNGNAAVSYLVDQMNQKSGFTTYAAVALPAATETVPNPTGTDAIRVAMIYKPAVVTPVGAPMVDADSINNRPPLAQTFKAIDNGGKFSVIVNHLKSKGGSCPSSGVNADNGDGQGCFNGTRIQQAQRLAGSFIPAVQRASGDDDVLVIGDLNSHGFEDPINVLTSAGMINQLERFVRPNGIVYSYNFDSLSGYLDHALASLSLSAQVSGASEWHNNADEPVVIDYNTDGKNQDLYVNNAYRASDHDPVIVSLNLAPAFSDVSASFSVVRSSLAAPRGSSNFAGTITLTNTSGAAVAGPVQVEIRGLPAGVTVNSPSGFHNGVPYITVSAASIAAGATTTVNLSLNNPSKGAMSYTTAIISGNF